MLVSIIVPAYRNEKTIKKDVENIHSVMSQTRWDFEVIVVVDGTNLDRTSQQAKKIKKKNVRVVGFESNKGKGYAVRYGMVRANGDVIAFIDAGMEINPNGISMLLEHMEWYDADIIVGSKRHPASKTNLSVFRKVYSLCYYLLVKFLFGLKVRDTQAGIKVFKREVLEKVLPRLLVKEFAFDVELLAVSKRLGFDRIFEAPIEIYLDFGEGSKIKKDWFPFLNPSIRLMLHDTLAVFYRLHILKYYDDSNKRRWVYDKELDMRINTGAVQK